MNDARVNNNTIASLDGSGNIKYNDENINIDVEEIIAGRGNINVSGYFNTCRPSYKYDGKREKNNDAVYKLWKNNPIIQNRISQMNSLVFGRGLQWIYDDDNIQNIINRFWRTNRLRAKLDAISTDAQLYGEVFIGLFPQKSGDVKIGIYASNQVNIDFSPDNILDIRKYIVSYMDEETNTPKQVELMPIEKFLNEIEYSTSINGNNIPLSLNNMIQNKSVMLHVKFNCSSDDVHGTSDFRQVIDILYDYMDFICDRLTIHQMYGSPSYDITIDTEDQDVVRKRVAELDGFSIGSNPVHNKTEEWKILEFKHSTMSVEEDDRILRGLISSGVGFPEHLAFNQTSVNGDQDNTFSIVKLAEDRQDSFADAFADMHKYAVYIAGGDIGIVDNGQIIFPEVNIMSQKAKAETYVLNVGAKICSRRTACTQIGHNWAIEEPQILIEEQILGSLMNNSDFAGAIGGRFTTRANQDGTQDTGIEDRVDRATSAQISTQVVGSGKRGGET